MIITIHQPNYLPYLGFFEKMNQADIFIIYDSTQYKTDDWQNRNKIRTKEGWMWLTIPVKHNFGDKINKIKIANPKVIKKHWKSIITCYSKAPYFEEYKKEFEKVYSEEWEKLSNFNYTLIKICARILGIKTKIVLASEIKNLQTKGPEALFELCKATKATKYISGKDGKKYFGEKWIKKFKEENIKIEYQEYIHPKYKQTYNGFEPYMCVLDLLFNHGKDSIKILINQK